MCNVVLVPWMLFEVTLAVLTMAATVEVLNYDEILLRFRHLGNLHHFRWLL